MAALPDGDAWAYLEALLNRYGLQDLMGSAKDWIINGLSENETMQRLRETPTYKKRFAVIEERRAKGLPPVSEAEVVQYEREATSLMQAAGLPPGFWDQPEDFQKLMVKDVSLGELDKRINQGYVAYSMAPAEDRAAFEQMYGMTAGEGAAYFIDPDRTQALLERKLAAAARAGESQRSGYGALSTDEAERLVGLGVEKGGDGFAQLSAQRQLFSSLPGEGAQDISREDQLGAVFGSDQNARDKIERRAKERVGAFSGGGQFVSGQGGFTGIGTAQ